LDALELSAPLPDGAIIALSCLRCPFLALPSQFVIPLVLMIHGGGKELENLREIKGEVNLRKLLEMNELPASCTVGDWLRRMGRDSRTEYTLDVDATIIEAEKAKAGWTYQKEKGYQPLLGFLFELGLALGDEFREGNVPAGARAVEFLDLCVRMMPKGLRK